MTESQTRRLLRLLELQTIQLDQVYSVMLMRMADTATTKVGSDAALAELDSHREFIRSTFKQLREEEQKEGIRDAVERAWNEAVDRELEKKPIGFKP